MLQNGGTALLEAVKRRHIEIAELLLANGASISINTADKVSYTLTTFLYLFCAYVYFIL